MKMNPCQISSAIGVRPSLAFGEVEEVFLVRHPCQFALRVVRPGMEPATEYARACSLLVPHQLVPAMRADVMKGTKLAVLATHHEDRGVTGDKIAHNVVAWCSNLFDPAHIEPDLAEYPFAFQFKVFTRHARLSRYRPCAYVRIFLRPTFVCDFGSHGVPPVPLAYRVWLLVPHIRQG